MRLTERLFNDLEQRVPCKGSAALTMRPDTLSRSVRRRNACGDGWAMGWQTRLEHLPRFGRNHVTCDNAYIGIKRSIDGRDPTCQSFSEDIVKLSVESQPPGYKAWR